MMGCLVGMVVSEGLKYEVKNPFNTLEFLMSRSGYTSKNSQAHCESRVLIMICDPFACPFI